MSHCFLTFRAIWTLYKSTTNCFSDHKRLIKWWSSPIDISIFGSNIQVWNEQRETFEDHQDSKLLPWPSNERTHGKSYLFMGWLWFGNYYILYNMGIHGSDALEETTVPVPWGNVCSAFISELARLYKAYAERSTLNALPWKQLQSCHHYSCKNHMLNQSTKSTRIA